MKNKKTRYIAMGVVAVVLLGVGIYMVKNVFPTVNATLEIANALEPFIDAENKSMHFLIDVEVEEKEFQLDADIYAIKDSSEDYMVIAQENACFYVVDNLLLLENGKAFLLTEENQDAQEHIVNYMDMMPLLAAAFEEFEINRIEEKGKVSYQIEVTGEQVKTILDATLPAYIESETTVEGLQVQLTTEDGNLKEIQIKGKVASNDVQNSLAVTISNFVVLEDGEYKIPQLIKDSARNVDKDKLFCLTEDLYRLMKVLEPLADTDTLQGSVTIHANCGILNIDTTVELDELQSLSIGSGNAVGQESTKIQNADEIQALPQLIGTMLMEGEISCIEKNDVYIYQLVLEDDAMKQLAETIAPEMVSYVVDFEKGSIELRVKENRVSMISVEIAGSMNVIITKVPVSVGAEFNFR